MLIIDCGIHAHHGIFTLSHLPFVCTLRKETMPMFNAENCDVIDLLFAVALKSQGIAALCL